MGANQQDFALRRAIGRIRPQAARVRLSKHFSILQYCLRELCANAEASNARCPRSDPVRVHVSVDQDRLKIEVQNRLANSRRDWQNIQNQLLEGKRPGGVRAALLGGRPARRGIGIVSVLTILRKLGGFPNSLIFERDAEGIVTARLTVRIPKSLGAISARRGRASGKER